MFFPTTDSALISIQSRDRPSAQVRRGFLTDHVTPLSAVLTKTRSTDGLFGNARKITSDGLKESRCTLEKT